MDYDTIGQAIVAASFLAFLGYLIVFVFLPAF